MKQSRYPTVEDPVQTIAAIVEAWLTQRRAGAIARVIGDVTPGATPNAITRTTAMIISRTTRRGVPGAVTAMLAPV